MSADGGNRMGQDNRPRNRLWGWLRQRRWRWLLGGSASLVVIIAVIGVANYYAAFVVHKSDVDVAQPAPTALVPQSSPTPETTSFVASPSPSPEAVSRPALPQLISKPGFPAVVDPPALFVVDADGGEPVLIHHAAQLPVWSPDGSRLAFSSGSKVYITEGSAGVTKPATEAEGAIHNLMWSPTGRRLAYEVSRFDAGRVIGRKIATLDSISGGVRELASGGEDLTLIAWLPGERELLVLRGSQLVKVDAASAAVAEIGGPIEAPREQLVMRGGQLFSNKVLLSPDGTRAMLIVSASGECRRGSATLVIVDLAEGKSSQPVPDLCRIHSAVWSPNGREIAYTVLEGEKGAYVLDLLSGQSRRLTAPTEMWSDHSVEWLADGSGLVVWRQARAFHDPPVDVVFVPAARGNEQILGTNSRFSAFGGFAPDARRYLYSDPIFSRDGRENSDIAVRVATLGGEAKALTRPDHASAYSHLTWAPTSDRIAYVRSRNDVPRRYAVDVETGEVKTYVAPNRWPFQVSPDGRLIAFMRHTTQDGARSQLWVSNSQGSDELLLVDGRYDPHSRFVWSPDSRWIAYRAEGEEGTVSMVDVMTAQSRQLAKLNGPLSISSWSPDGSKLAVRIWEEGRSLDSGSLVIIEAATGGSTILARGIEVYPPYQPEWSPDGGKLLFWVRGARQNSDLMLVNSDGSGRRNLITTPRLLLDFSWSPDGRAVAFWRSLSAPSGGKWVTALYLTSVETGQERELMRIRTGSTMPRPAWSPDGRRIAVYLSWEVEQGIYAIEADGSGMTHVVAGGGDLSNIAWSANGRQILFTWTSPGI